MHLISNSSNSDMEVHDCLQALVTRLHWRIPSTQWQCMYQPRPVESHSGALENFPPLDGPVPTQCFELVASCLLVGPLEKICYRLQ